MSFARACILLLFSVSLSIIPLKQEPVKCKSLCALSAPSSLDVEMIICNFFVILGENFLRIYTYGVAHPTAYAVVCLEIKKCICVYDWFVGFYDNLF